MSCPDLETLGSALDLDPEDPRHLAIASHLRECAACEQQASLLRDVELALGTESLWRDASTGCLQPHEMLRALAGESGARPDHLHGCSVCQTELDALRSEERAEVSPSLKARLRGLAATSTTEDLPADVRIVSGGRRRSGAGRVSSRGRVGSSRVSGSGRTRSGAGRISSRRGNSGTGRLRRSGVSRRSVRAPRGGVKQPAWAWGVLAAAAVLLVALALALQPPPQRDLARADDPTQPLSEGAVRVSDVQGKLPRTSKPREATDPEAVEPSYPLPSPTEESGRWVSEPSDDEDLDSATTQEPAVASPAPASPTRAKPAEPQPQAPVSEEPERIVDDGGRLEVAMNRLRGGLTLERDGARTRLTRRSKNVRLRPGDRLVARTGGFLSLEDGAYELSLDQGTELVVRAAQAGPLLRLDAGKVMAEVATLPAGKRFGVTTREAEFSVLGTVFAVEATEGRSRLLVAEGTVKASAGGRAVQVPAGMGATVQRSAPPSAPDKIRAEELAWAGAWSPKRQVLYAVGFDDNKLGGFTGTLSSDHQTRGGNSKALALSPLEGNRYWGQRAQVPKGRMPGFRAAPDVFVQFSVWVEKPAALLLQVYNDSQAKEFKRSLEHPGGYWRTYTVPLMGLSTYYDPGKNPVRENDLFVDLELYAVEPGDARRVLIDDVAIFRKLYR